jgi:hypothetical protein
MAESKYYLNVPFAQKDEAKALGAKWDAVKKKWYVPTDKDMMLFRQWHVNQDAVTPQRTKASSKSKTSESSKNSEGIYTYALDKEFVAYNGDLPPWE